MNNGAESFVKTIRWIPHRKIDFLYLMCYYVKKESADMKENILIDKSIYFAARIIKLHKYLITKQKETIISKQIVRSGTSIGANINEGNYGQSRADFIAKMHIALKETAETEYWLKLLILSEYISEKEGQSLLCDCLEIKRMLISSINTAKNNLN